MEALHTAGIGVGTGPASAGRRFATALSGRDGAALRQVLAEDIDFRALTPRQAWQGGSSEEALQVMLGSWFTEDDHIDGLVGLTEGPAVGDTAHVGYRLAVTTDDVAYTVEQQAYYRCAGDRISFLRVLCSGYRPVRGS